MSALKPASLALLGLVFALPAASLADSPPEPAAPISFGKVGIEVEFLTSAFGSGETWTVFRDGRIQQARVGGRGGGTSALRHGRLDEKGLAALRQRVAQSGLLEAKYTQPHDPNLLTEGVTRLTLSKGEARHELSPPRVGTPSAETKRLSRRLSAFGGELAKFLEPHLGEPLPTGRYARVTLIPAKYANRFKAETSARDLAQHLHPALATEGLYVRLREGDEAIRQGARWMVQGRLVIWIVDHFEGKK